MVMPRDFVELSGALARLRAQTIRERIQVVVVHTPRGRGQVQPEQFNGFCGVDTVEVDQLPTVASGQNVRLLIKYVH